MRNANETRKITDAVLEARAKEREEKIQNFVEEKIAPVIEAMAERGYDSVEVSVSGTDKKRVEEILEENDYTIAPSSTYGCIVVKW